MTDLAWIDGPDGYGLAFDGGKVVCRNPQGRRLAAVPKALRDADAVHRLEALERWLRQHARECAEAVERWMLRSLPAPRGLIEAVWADPDWRGPLENLVVFPVDAAGEPRPDAGGFLRGARPGAVGVVTLDGETAWLEADRLAVPHPILMPELADFRELAAELGLAQGARQLFREVFARGPDHADHDRLVGDFAGGRFGMLAHALGRARSLGYRVSGGYAVCPVWEAGRKVEARFWLGADAPDEETVTEGLGWVDAREHGLALREVGPVAFSEGMRMASAIYAGRAKEEEGEDE